MPSKFIRFPDGGGAFVRYSNPPRKRCRYCRDWSTRLCDHPMRDGKTCDVPMCEAHTHRPAGSQKDFCQEHRP